MLIDVPKDVGQGPCTAPFTDELDRWSLVDEARLLELARREVERREHRLVGLPVVLLDLSPTTREEQLLLARLVAAAPATLAAGDSVLINVDGVGATDEGAYTLNVARIDDTCPDQDLGSTTSAAVT